MNTVLKVGCLAIYLLAFAGIFTEIPFGATSAIQWAAVLLLGAHLLEILVFRKYVKMYRGGLAPSILLTLLFGFLHWLPLARAHAASDGAHRGQK